MNMKMKRETFAKLRDLIAPLDTEERRQAYREGRFPRSENVKDLDRRYRWDLYWAIPLAVRAEVSQEFRSQDLNDNHIDTAFRRIVEPL